MLLRDSIALFNDLRYIILYCSKICYYLIEGFNRIKTTILLLA